MDITKTVCKVDSNKMKGYTVSAWDGTKKQPQGRPESCP